MNKVVHLKSAGCKFLFSPAHLEEIAVSEMIDKVAIDVINRDIEFLTEVCERNAVISKYDNRPPYYDELPRDCYERVVAKYKVNKQAEDESDAILWDANVYPAGSPRVVNNCAPDKILSNSNYTTSLFEHLKRHGWINELERYNFIQGNLYSCISKSHDIFECAMVFTTDLLEKIGYRREGIKNGRARLHDVSHMIYGRYADVFVTEDKKLHKKTQAAYSFLGVPTLVYPMNEFANIDSLEIFSVGM
ncbi:hypothetical protein ACSZNN_09965 [Aeromonas hydrophila]